MHARFARFVRAALVLAVVAVGAGCRGPSSTAVASDPAPAATPLPSAYFTIVNEQGRAVALTESDFAKFPRTTATVEEREQTETVEGVPLPELLKLVNAPLGQGLRGGALALYVVVDAADRYQAVFALAELDPGMTDRVVLLADRKDGRPLADGEGPLRVVVTGEKRHARWVRQAVRLTLCRAAPPK